MRVGGCQANCALRLGAYEGHKEAVRPLSWPLDANAVVGDVHKLDIRAVVRYRGVSVPRVVLFYREIVAEKASREERRVVLERMRQHSYA